MKDITISTNYRINEMGRAYCQEFYRTNDAPDSHWWLMLKEGTKTIVATKRPTIDAQGWVLYLSGGKYGGAIANLKSMTQEVLDVAAEALLRANQEGVKTQK